MVVRSEDAEKTFRAIKDKIVPAQHNLCVLGHYKPNGSTMLINLAAKDQRDEMKILIDELSIPGVEVKNSGKLLPTNDQPYKY